MGNEANVACFFVDEAGDMTLFDKRGKPLVGTEGCSRCFLVGVASLPQPAAAAQALSILRADLLADPYFKGVPSMQPQVRKTSVYFHAKDDLPEVRREVFRVLRGLEAKVLVAIRRKDTMVPLARRLYEQGKRLTPNDVYDDMVKRLFRDVLHKADENRVYFARRGKSTRYKAMRRALDKARANFERKWGRPSDKPTTIRSVFPRKHAGLQVIDYYLWALQRLYERREDRYFELLRPNYRLIMDLDDKRQHRYGEYYSDSNPLTLRKMKAF